MPEKTSREVISDNQVSFAIDWSLSENWLLIENLSGRSLQKVFSMSQEVYLEYFYNWLYLTFPERSSLEVFRRKISIEVFSRNQRFDQNPE